MSTQADITAREFFQDGQGRTIRAVSEEFKISMRRAADIFDALRRDPRDRVFAACFNETTLNEMQFDGVVSYKQADRLRAAVANAA